MWSGLNWAHGGGDNTSTGKTILLFTSFWFYVCIHYEIADGWMDLLISILNGLVMSLMTGMAASIVLLSLSLMESGMMNTVLSEYRPCVRRTHHRKALSPPQCHLISMDTAPLVCFHTAKLYFWLLINADTGCIIIVAIFVSC